MSTQPNPPPAQHHGRDRFIYGPLRNRKMRNPDPETPEEAFEEHNVQFYVAKSGKYISRKWNDTKHVFEVCTKGFEAKVINVVGYSILQVVLDLTVLQLMVLQGDITPTTENMQTLALFFCTTIIGAVVSVYRSPIGTTLLIMTQLAGVVVVYEHFSHPMIMGVIQKFLEQRREYPFQTNILVSAYHTSAALFYIIVYFFPTVLGIWFIYCTVMLMGVLLGFRIYENQDNQDPFAVLSIIPTPESSTLMETPQSTPAETDYFSDNSSL